MSRTPSCHVQHVSLLTFLCVSLVAARSSGLSKTKYFQFCKIKKVERACRTCFTSCNVRFVINIPETSDKCDRCDKLAVVVRNDARNVLVQQNTVFNSITNINVNVNVIQNNIEIVAPREPWQAPVLTIDAAAYARDSKRKVKVRPVKSKVRLEGISVKVFESRDVQRDFCRSFTDSIGLDEKVCAREAPEQPLNSSLNVSHAVVSRPARLLADLPLCFSRGGSFLGTVQTNIFSVLQDQESGARVSHVLHKLQRAFRD